MLNWCVGAWIDTVGWYVGSTSIFLMLRIVHSWWNVSSEAEMQGKSFKQNHVTSDLSKGLSRTAGLQASPLSLVSMCGGTCNACFVK